MNFKVIISCPALIGCHSQGETEQEAIANIKDAIVGCLEVLNEKARDHWQETQLLPDNR